MAIRLEAIAIRLEAIAIRLEAIGTRVEAIAIRLEGIAKAISLGLEVWRSGYLHPVGTSEDTGPNGVLALPKAEERTPAHLKDHGPSCWTTSISLSFKPHNLGLKQCHLEKKL